MYEMLKIISKIFVIAKVKYSCSTSFNHTIIYPNTQAKEHISVE
jgi:hypothetical protein